MLMYSLKYTNLDAKLNEVRLYTYIILDILVILYNIIWLVIYISIGHNAFGMILKKFFL